jgi:hypothetical protein
MVAIRNGNILVGIFFAGLVSGCAASLTDEQAKQKALAVLPAGTVQKVEAAGDDKTVTVKMPSGGIVVVEVEEDGSLEELSSKQGPFDYDITISGALTFVQAREKAFMQKTGVVEAWEWNAEEVLWEFYVRNADTKLYEIKLKSTDGSLIGVEQKDMVD